MKFVRTDDLKPGMRLAKPIYNKNGVLLYERNTKLNQQGILMITNFGLLGIYILEPAEPLPPLSAEDIEFERFQTMNVFGLEEDMNRLLKKKRPNKLLKIAGDIIKAYGRMNHKINFIQNLRSPEDYVYKHSLNTAILCALIAKTRKLSTQEQNDLVIAALLHDIGKVNLPFEMRMGSADLSEENQEYLRKVLKESYDLVQINFNLSSRGQRILSQFLNPKLDVTDRHTLEETKILLVANRYDTMTAMKEEEPPSSEVVTLRHLLDGELYDKEIVKSLTESIYILSSGVSVELTNGEKGLVLSENPDNILCPMVLGFQTNTIYNLAVPSVAEEVQIKDIMKTMDNRMVIDDGARERFMKMFQESLDK